MVSFAWSALCALLLTGSTFGSFILRDPTHGESSSTFSVLQAPSYVGFSSDAGALPAREVEGMAAYALGLAPSRGLTWNGLMPGSLFRRPKANVMFVVEGLPQDQSLDLEHIVQVPLSQEGSDRHQRLHSVSTGKNLASHVSGLFHGKSLVLSLAGSEKVAREGDASSAGNAFFWNAEKKVFTAVSSTKDLFHNLAATELSEQLKSFAWPKGIHCSGSSVEVELKDGQKVTFDMGKKVDAEFLAELAATLAVHGKLAARPALVRDSIPDVMTFTLSGLKTVQLRYGSKSSQIQAALAVLRAVLPVVVDEFSKLYNGDAIIELVQLHFDDSFFENHASVVEQLFQYLHAHLETQTLPEFRADLPRIRLAASSSAYRAAICDKAQRHLSSLKSPLLVVCNDELSHNSLLHVGRHLLSEQEKIVLDNSTNITSLNLAFERDADWPATFTMIFLLMLIFILSLLAITYTLWNMDPGYDSIIYRMTNQRLKMD